MLLLTGRECINRGGEIISPVEVEDALSSHHAVERSGLMCFSAPHAQLQEVVGVAVLHDCEVGLTQLRAWASSRLSPAKLPQVLVLVAELPKTSTLQLKRVGFAQLVGLPVLDGPPRCFWYDSTQYEGSRQPAH